MGNIFSEIRPEPEAKKNVIYYSDEEQYIGLDWTNFPILTYLGECNGEAREGYGVYTYSNGDKYEGNWLNNMKEGKGYFFYNNGELYMGHW